MLINMEIKPRQLEIIEVAGKLLTHSGISGLTIKNLASEMNFSEGAVYRHFKSKEEIMLTLLRHLHENVVRIIGEVLMSGDFEEDFTSLFGKLARYFKNNPYYVVAVFSEGLMEESDRVNGKIMQLISTLTGCVQVVIKKGQEQHLIIDSLSAEQIAQIVVPSFKHQMFKWKMSNFTSDIEQEVDELTHALIRLLKVRT